MRRRAIYIIQPFFLLLVMLPLLAVSLLHYRQLASQHRGTERLEKEHLQTISIPVASLQWAKPGKEIWVNNQLFDVKSYQYENGVYTFRGLYDEDETLIVKQVRQENSQQDANNTRVLGQLFKLLHSIYSNTEGEQMLAVDTNSRYYIQNDTSPLALYSIVNTPPPRIG